MDLPQYRSYKVVRALKIAAITELVSDGSVEITGPGGEVVRAKRDFLKRFHGGGTELGYYVVYADGYESWSPSKAFEEGYSPDTGNELTHKPLPVAEHVGLPVHGFTPQSPEKVALVNFNKEMEERVLRRIDDLDRNYLDANGRWLSVARTHIEQGFGAMNRAILQPQRIALPEDAVRAEIKRRIAEHARPQDNAPFAQEFSDRHGANKED